MNNKIVLFGLIVILNIIIINALSVNIPSVFGVTYKNDTNSSDYWDNLDTPADILGSQITNDLGWASGGGDTWSTNYSLYWTAVVINNILSGNSTAWLSTYNATYHNNINTDSWSGNYTNYYNKTLIDNNFTKYVPYIGATKDVILGNNNFNVAGNATIAGMTFNHSVAGDTKLITFRPGTYFGNKDPAFPDRLYFAANGDSIVWSNFSEWYYPQGGRIEHEFWGSGTVAYTDDSGLGYANLEVDNNITITEDGFFIGDGRYLYNVNTSGTDSWSLNYTFYYPLIHTYNKTEVDNNFSLYMLISSWYTNLTSINNNINLNNTNAKLYANTNIAGNLSLALLADGSRALTENWNVGGKNITNIDNITMTGKLSFGNGNYIQSNITCTKIYGSTSLLEIC